MGVTQTVANFSLLNIFFTVVGVVQHRYKKHLRDQLKVLNLGELQKFQVHFTMKDMTPKVKLDSDALV